MVIGIYTKQAPRWPAEKS